MMFWGGGGGTSKPTYVCNSQIFWRLSKLSKPTTAFALPFVAHISRRGLDQACQNSVSLYIRNLSLVGSMERRCTRVPPFPCLWLRKIPNNVFVL